MLYVHGRQINQIIPRFRHLREIASLRGFTQPRNDKRAKMSLCSAVSLFRSNTFIKENGSFDTPQDIETMVQNVSETSYSSTSTSPSSLPASTTNGESSESATSSSPSSSEATSSQEINSNYMAEFNSAPETNRQEEVNDVLDSIPPEVVGCLQNSDLVQKPSAASEVAFSMPSTPRCSIPEPSPQQISDKASP